MSKKSVLFLLISFGFFIFPAFNIKSATKENPHSPCIIGQLATQKWETCKKLYLTALETDPLAFKATSSEANSEPQKTWEALTEYLWFAFVDNKIVGMIELVQEIGIKQKHCGVLSSHWVHPDFRRQGIGTALIKHIQSYAPKIGIKKLSLSVLINNDSSLNLYESLGFVIRGTLEQGICIFNIYYDEFYMECAIPEIQQKLPLNPKSNPNALF